AQIMIIGDKPFPNYPNFHNLSIQIEVAFILMYDLHLILLLKIHFWKITHFLLQLFTKTISLMTIRLGLVIEVGVGDYDKTSERAKYLILRKSEKKPFKFSKNIKEHNIICLCYFPETTYLESPLFGRHITIII
ncbi:hypothetical protein ACJX0J_015709, partial [Zea mays]